VKLIVIGSEGNVGRRLMAAFPGAIGIDRASGADIVADLATIDYEAPAVRAAFETTDGVVHVGTEPNPDAPDAVHYAAVTAAARLLEACLRYKVPRLVLPSSGWADPKPEFGPINAYGHSKRVFEAMAAMYANTGARAVALRIGWVALNQEEVDAAYPALRADYWDTATLVARVKAALGE
jgi:nucleoside-diphosphate-sugar epimerase